MASASFVKQLLIPGSKCHSQVHAAVMPDLVSFSFDTKEVYEGWDGRVLI